MAARAGIHDMPLLKQVKSWMPGRSLSSGRPSAGPGGPAGRWRSCGASVGAVHRGAAEHAGNPFFV